MLSELNNSPIATTPHTCSLQILSLCPQVSYQTALAAVFIEGWILLILAVTGLRMRLIRLVPKSMMLATSAGIGLFLAFVGLQNIEGLGIVSYDSTTLVTLGGCPAEYQVRCGTTQNVLQLQPIRACVGVMHMHG